MGASPPRNWVQRVTIEVPGPVTNQEKWEEYKKKIDQLIANYRNSVKPQITGIQNVRLAGVGGPVPGVTTVKKTSKKKKKKGSKRKKR